ncbi:MAG: hypothetical protein PF570_07715 [Candidatus Cloacimonetes bacterium]|jgi:hypothetical protein|nr:hypothetical protein [Candidatus Cloacimonadota bacterium]
MKTLKIVMIIMILLVAFELSATKYAGEIFQIGAGVRNFALGNCGVSDVNSSSIAYWNSALLMLVEENRFELMHAEEYSGLLSYDTASAIWGKTNKFSVVLTRIGIDDIPLTKLEDPTDSLYFGNRPYKYSSVNNSDIVVYFGFSRKFGKYNLGFTPKLAYRNLADENGVGFGADISTFFMLSKKTILAVKLRDFFSTQILWGNGTHEIVNPSLDSEINHSFIIPVFKWNSTAYLRTEIFAEGRDTSSSVALGPLSLDYHLGYEVNLHSAVDLYMGYDLTNITSGLKLKIKNWDINYSFEYDNELENSHRVSVGLNL